MNDHDPDRHITDNDAYLAKKRERFKEHQARMTMEKGRWAPRLHERIVTSRGDHGAIRQHDRDLLLVQLDNGTTEWRRPDELRKERFTEFITLPTGFGKTPWAAFIALQLLLALFIGLGFAERAPWSGLLTYAMVNATLVFGSWMNYTGRWK